MFPIFMYEYSILNVPFYLYIILFCDDKKKVNSFRLLQFFSYRNLVELVSMNWPRLIVKSCTFLCNRINIAITTKPFTNVCSLQSSLRYVLCPLPRTFLRKPTGEKFYSTFHASIASETMKLFVQIWHILLAIYNIYQW